MIAWDQSDKEIVGKVRRRANKPERKRKWAVIECLNCDSLYCIYVIALMWWEWLVYVCYAYLFLKCFCTCLLVPPTTHVGDSVHSSPLQGGRVFYELNSGLDFSTMLEWFHPLSLYQLHETRHATCHSPKKHKVIAPSHDAGGKMTSRRAVQAGRRILALGALVEWRTKHTPCITNWHLNRAPVKTWWSYRAY